MDYKDKTEEGLIQKIGVLQAILDNIPDIAWLKDRESRYIAVNGPFAKACGMKPEEVVGRSDLELWPADLAERYRADDKEVMRSGRRRRIEEPLRDKAGRVRCIETIKTPVYNGEGQVIGTTGIARDITRRKRVEERMQEARDELEIRVKVRTAELTKANEDLLNEIQERRRIEEMLRQNQERYRLIVEDQTELICCFAPDGIITFVNEAYCRYFGRERQELIGKSFMPFIPEADHKKVEENFARLSRENPVMAHEHRVIAADGSVRWQQWVNRMIFSNEGKFLEFQAVGRDITERKKIEQEKEKLNNELLKSNLRFRRLSLMDPHTGLYNHRYLQEMIEAEFYRARRYAHPLAVIMLDIDYFKSINEVYGHHFGDLVLKLFAKQLKKMVRRYDTVIRFGGEEFIIVSPGIDRPQAMDLAQRLLGALNLYNFGDKKHTVKLKLSLAVASYPEDRIARGIDLINVADQIINKVKECGGNRVYSSLDINRDGRLISEAQQRNPDIKILKGKIDKLTKKANQNLAESIFAFAKTIELKDHYTGRHVENTVHYAAELAMELDLPKGEIELVRQAAMLHDLGKIGIAESILLKKSKLTRSEFQEIRKHPQIGADIIRPVQFLHGLIPFIFYHHERWDGKGYPSGIKGEDIPLGARIIAIADVYQALISDRPYRRAFSKKEAIQIIKDGSGRQFDPRIASILLRIIQKE